MALVQKAFSDIITFSRSSNATRVGPTGLVEYAPHNLLQRSQEFDNAYWTKGNASATANAIAAPDGTVTADSIIENTAAAQHEVSVGFTFSGSTVYTLSVYAKANGRNLLVYVDGFAGGRNFDLSDGTVGSVVGTAPSAATITSVGNGWYRCTITFTWGAGATANVRFLLLNGTTNSYTGNGTSGIYLWGAQLSVGPYALDYTPTTSAAVYGPRFDYDPVTLAARGLLVEESRTNLVMYSEQFDNAAWAANDVTISANAAASPDGTVTADTLTENTAASTHRVFQILTSTAAAYTASVFAKAGTRNWIYLRVRDSGNVDRHAWFNLSTGAIGTTDSGITASIQAVGSGWYRCIATIATASSGGANQPVVIGMASADNTTTYTGNGTGSVSLWGAQLEAGSFATSLIPTLASTVTRSADVASVNTLSPFYNAVEGTLFAELSGLLSTSYFQAPAYNFGDSNNRIELRAVGNPFTYNRSVVTTAGVTQVDISSTGLPSSASTPRKVALAYKLDDFATVGTGGTVATDTSGTIPTVSVLNIGTAPYDSSIKTNGWIARIAYYPRRLTNAELQALTA